MFVFILLLTYWSRSSSIMTTLVCCTARFGWSPFLGVFVCLFVCTVAANMTVGKSTHCFEVHEAECEIQRESISTNKKWSSDHFLCWVGFKNQCFSLKHNSSRKTYCETFRKSKTWNQRPLIYPEILITHLDLRHRVTARMKEKLKSAVSRKFSLKTNLTIIIWCLQFYIYMF